MIERLRGCWCTPPPPTRPPSWVRRRPDVPGGAGKTVTEGVVYPAYARPEGLRALAAARIWQRMTFFAEVPSNWAVR